MNLIDLCIESARNSAALRKGANGSCRGLSEMWCTGCSVGGACWRGFVGAHAHRRRLAQGGIV